MEDTRKNKGRFAWTDSETIWSECSLLTSDAHEQKVRAKQYFALGGIITFDKEQISCKTKDFHQKIGTTIYEDVWNMRIMENTSINNIVLVRGCNIDEQLKDSQSTDETLDGAMHVSLSQESLHVFSADQNFIIKLQELQKTHIKDINLIIKPQQEKYYQQWDKLLKL